LRRLLGGFGRERAARPSTGHRLVHEPADVLVEERERLLGLGAHRVRPRAGRPGRRHEALYDETVWRLDEKDLAHPAVVEEGADRPEHLLEVLARGAFVD